MPLGQSSSNHCNQRCSSRPPCMQELSKRIHFDSLRHMAHRISLLDSRSIRYRVRERESKLNNICSSFLHRKHNGHRVVFGRIASGHESDQSWATLWESQNKLQRNRTRIRTFLSLPFLEQFSNGVRHGGRCEGSGWVYAEVRCQTIRSTNFYSDRHER